MNFGPPTAYLTALALLAGAGLWWELVPGAGHVRAAALAVSLGALFIAFFAVGHMWLRNRRWNREKQEELARREAQLEQARETYQALLDHSDIMIFTLDGEGRYQAMNRYGLAMLGADMADIQGKYIEEHLDQAGAARFRELMAAALAQGSAGRNLEPLQFGRRERFMDIHLKLLEGGPDISRGVLVLMHDRTEQKLVDERMWQTEKLASLGLLAAGVAHQINNPLGIMMGFGQLLLDGSGPEQKGHRELSIILEQGRECKRIVDGLLSFTRLSEIGSGGCDLLAGLHAVLDTVRPVLEGRGIELVTDLAPALPGCRAQSGAMQQVFLNLIANAMDAMAGGGRLLITARALEKQPRQGSLHGTLPASERYVELAFQDSGAGIAPEHLERIYDPFFTTKPVGQGTGLGLSVAYGIVREHGGTITTEPPLAEGDGPAMGARFVIRLPVEGGATARNPEPDTSTPPRAGA